MRLDPRLHVVALDGVYPAGADGLPAFRPLGHVKTDEVADVLQIAKVRILKALERRGPPTRAGATRGRNRFRVTGPFGA